MLLGELGMDMMDGMDKSSTELLSVFGKPLHREALRKLSLPEKVRIVVELQKIAAPILRARGENPFVWDLERAERQRGND